MSLNLRTAALLALAAGTALAQSAIVIQTGTVLDGRGGTLQNRQIVIEGSRIRSVDRQACQAGLRSARPHRHAGLDRHPHPSQLAHGRTRQVGEQRGKPEDAALFTETTPG